jgi:hypothetical protein
LVSGAERSHSERAVGATIGAQDTKIPAVSFPYTYMALIAGNHIGIRQEASSISMRADFITQNVKFKKL